LLVELEVHIDGNSCICYQDESPGEHKTLTPAGLTERLSKWLLPTELGYLYKKTTTKGNEQFLNPNQEDF
tara:strand:- start:518 stop:727 length:210 start_codon:yes stop_codon:yes gene_type:complete